MLRRLDDSSAPAGSRLAPGMEPDVQALTGPRLAMRPARTSPDRGLLRTLRDAIKAPAASWRRLSARGEGQSTRAVSNLRPAVRQIEPPGWARETRRDAACGACSPHRAASMPTSRSRARPDLTAALRERSFGAFQENPVTWCLRLSPTVVDAWQNSCIIATEHDRKSTNARDGRLTVGGVRRCVAPGHVGDHRYRSNSRVSAPVWLRLRHPRLPPRRGIRGSAPPPGPPVDDTPPLVPCAPIYRAIQDEIARILIRDGVTPDDFLDNIGYATTPAPGAGPAAAWRQRPNATSTWPRKCSRWSPAPSPGTGNRHFTFGGRHAERSPRSTAFGPPSTPTRPSLWDAITRSYARPRPRLFSGFLTYNWPNMT